MESVIRLACLATVIGNIGAAKKFLLQATEAHRQRGDEAKKRTSIVPFKTKLGGLYSMVMTHCEAAQHAEIANQLESLRRRWEKATEAILELGSDERAPRR